MSPRKVIDNINEYLPCPAQGFKTELTDLFIERTFLKPQWYGSQRRKIYFLFWCPFDIKSQPNIHWFHLRVLQVVAGVCLTCGMTFLTCGFIHCFKRNLSACKSMLNGLFFTNLWNHSYEYNMFSHSNLVSVSLLCHKPLPRRWLLLHQTLCERFGIYRKKCNLGNDVSFGRGKVMSDVKKTSVKNTLWNPFMCLEYRDFNKVFKAFKQSSE